jgi:thiol:disulfide interchange protein DsbD
MKRILAALLLLLPALSLTAYAAAEEELLEPDLAFVLSTRVIDAHTLEASWKIAPGYYMYRDKFKFEALDSAITLKPAVIPAGKKKSDPLFGEVETYIQAVKIRLPIERRGDGTLTARIKISAQGCNEPIGVCYPPLIKEVGFTLPAITTAALKTTTASPNATGPIKSLKDLARTIDPGNREQEAVDPEKAFTVTVISQGNALLARIDIADCCYLYRDKTRIALTAADGAALPAGVSLGTYKLPAGKVKLDPFIGKTEIYQKGFDVRLPVEGVAGKNLDLALRLTYQGCSEKGVSICYPPATKIFRVTSQAGLLSVVPETGIAAVGSALKSPAGPTPSDARTLILAMLAAFGAGLLLTFTPCVLPMIPILSSVIVRSGDITISKLRGGLLSYTYVLGTAVTYTLGGALAGATGDQLQSYFQNPWAIGTFSTILLLLALSMFGLYEVQMPGFVQSRLHFHTHKIKGGNFIGVFVLGLVSALIVGACVSPVLISVLGAAIVAKDPVLGAGIMFALAHGQGMILVALGVGAGFLLPKAGHWMDRVKYVFGVMLIAVAIYLLGYLPQVPVMLLWAALFIITAVYLGATQSLPKDANGWQFLWKGLGTVFLIWGALALLGGLTGSRDILNPLPLSGGLTVGVPVQASTQPTHLFERVTSVKQFDAKLAEAKAAGKPVLLDYYATWCTDCVRMEQATFTQARVRQELQRFVLVQIDVTDPNDPEAKAIKSRFGVFGPPAMLFFASDGTERRTLRTYGFRGPDEFIALLRQI